MDLGIYIKSRSRAVQRMKKPTPIRLAIEILTSSPRTFVYLLRGCPISLTSDPDVVSLMKQGFSFVRWGDGETAIVRRKSISYQESNLKLREKLIHLSAHPFKTVIFGLPWAAYVSPFDERWNKRIFGIMFSTRVYWAKRFRSQFKQVNMSRTEFWWDHANEIPTILTSLHRQGRNLVLVGPKKFLSLCPEKTEFIEIDSQDAFATYEKLSETVSKLFIKYGSTLTLLAAAGPTTKALVNDFADSFQILDIGHGFDFALNGYGAWSWSLPSKIIKKK